MTDNAIGSAYDLWTLQRIHSTLIYMLIAVDTGGSKTLVTRISDDGKIVTKVQFPTPKSTDEYTTNVQNAITEIVGKDSPAAICVAMPGVVIDDVAISCPNLGWKDFDIRPPLAARFPGVPVWVENDANLAGLGETCMLAPVPAFSLYVTVSTGIGTGFTSNGKIDSGLRLSEGGHMVIEYDGLPRRWETFASGSAIYKTYGKYARDITSKRAWQHIADRLSRGFLSIIPLTQPEIIIIGGSIGTYFDRYGEQLEGILREKLPAHVPCPKLVQAKHPEEAVIYGCYYHAKSKLTHHAAKR